MQRFNHSLDLLDHSPCLRQFFVSLHELFFEDRLSLDIISIVPVTLQQFLLFLTFCLWSPCEQTLNLCRLLKRIVLGMEPIISGLVLLTIDEVNTDRAQVIFDLYQVREGHRESILSDGFAHWVLGMKGTLHEGSKMDTGSLLEEGVDCVSNLSLIETVTAHH